MNAHRNAKPKYRMLEAATGNHSTLGGRTGNFWLDIGCMICLQIFCFIFMLQILPSFMKDMINVKLSNVSL